LINSNRVDKRVFLSDQYATVRCANGQSGQLLITKQPDVPDTDPNIFFGEHRRPILTQEKPWKVGTTCVAKPLMSSKLLKFTHTLTVLGLMHTNSIYVDNWPHARTIRNRLVRNMAHSAIVSQGVYTLSPYPSVIYK